MDPELTKRLDALAAELALVKRSLDKTRQYLLWSFLVQLGLVLVPLLALMVAIPFLLGSLSGLYGEFLS
jgi:hypothetical protein